MKTCLCAIAKNENLYIRDWVDYHRRKGFDHIVVADNNDPGDDSLIITMNDYIIDGYVTYRDCRGKVAHQNEFYAEAYSEMRGSFDWIAFWDVDEFLDGVDDIGAFLSSKAFAKCNLVYLNWKCYGDSGKVAYEPLPVYERFTEPYPRDIEDPTWRSHRINSHVKTIARTCGKGIKFSVPHNGRLVGARSAAVNAAGRKCDETKPWQEICWEGAWLNHYCTLTIEEFFSRRMDRGRATTSKRRTPQELVDQFFVYNKNTKAKMEVLSRYFSNIKEH